MSVLFILIPVSLVFATAFLGVFFWAVRSGQFEDTCTPSMRLLADDAAPVTRVVQGGSTGSISDGGVPLRQQAKTISNDED